MLDRVKDTFDLDPERIIAEMPSSLELVGYVLNGCGPPDIAPT
jgi:hypothetical protein